MEKFKSLAEQAAFLELTPEEATLLFYLFAFIIAQPLTIDEINLLANGLFETAQILFVIASQRTLINNVIQAKQDTEEAEKAKEEKQCMEQLVLEIQKLQRQMKYLQQQMDGLMK